MSKQRWLIEQKIQYVTTWWASGLTRQQYCELNDIPFTAFRECPQDVAKTKQRANEPTVLPVHMVYRINRVKPGSPVFQAANR